MKKKKKKKDVVYCFDGPCQGWTFKIKSGGQEFWVDTSSLHPFYKKVHYVVVTRVAFTNKLIATFAGYVPRKKEEK